VFKRTPSVESAYCIKRTSGLGEERHRTRSGTLTTERGRVVTTQGQPRVVGLAGERRSGTCGPPRVAHQARRNLRENVRLARSEHEQRLLRREEMTSVSPSSERQPRIWILVCSSRESRKRAICYTLRGAWGRELHRLRFERRLVPGELLCHACPDATRPTTLIWRESVPIRPRAVSRPVKIIIINSTIIVAAGR